jgi:hypothetical protein
MSRVINNFKGEIVMLKQMLYKVLGGTAVVVFLAGTVHAETWPKDPITDCQVWSADDGGAKEVITWSGSCENGKATGSGVLVVHDKDGLSAVYNGEMTSGKVNGTGSLKFRSVDKGGFNRFLGSFVDGHPTGYGIYRSIEGFTFFGKFNGRLDSGEGLLKTEKDKATILGQFVDGKLNGPAVASYTTEDGEYYFGGVENKQRHGVGTLIHADQSAYIGDFKNGVASGVGAYEGADGSVTVGQFDESSPNGAASYIAPDKDVYQGMFAGGKLNGMVLVTKIDGTQSIENWKNGEKQE